MIPPEVVQAADHFANRHCVLSPRRDRLPRQLRMRFEDQPFGLVPAETGVGDGDAMCQGDALFPRLFAGIEVALEHEAHDRLAAFAELPEHLACNQALPRVILVGIVMRAIAHDRPSDAFAGGRQALELTGRLGELSVPVQVIWGRKDQILPVSHAEGLPAAVPVTVLDDAGHLAHMEKAAEVNQKIRAFIG